MQLLEKSKFNETYKYIMEAMDMPPPEIRFNIPPAYVQSVDTFKGSVRSDEMHQVETVIACLVLEAGGEGTVGMEAVNEVIHNRAKNRQKSLYQIVTAPKQFSCFNSGVTAAIQRAKKHPKWNEAIRILKNKLTNHTMGADHYHTLSVKPYWGKDLLKRGYRTITIKHHIFYYL